MHHRRYLPCLRNVLSLCQSRTFTDKVVGRKTCLYDFHLENKAKMVDFAGFEMPVVYGDQTISSSHNHTRNHVSIFDVSHMLQSTLYGKDSIPFLESLTVSDIQGLEENHSTLSLFTNDAGGIKDDLIITKTEYGGVYIVSNAGCIAKDIAHIQNNLKSFKGGKADVQFKVITDKALLAVQGPGSAKVLQSLVEYDLSTLTFMTSIVTSVCGIEECRITRCGYTGEDGVEISVPVDKARFIVENILSSNDDSVKLAGLAVRDSLRLEAGLCLYGNDITEDTTPVEAGLTWTIGKRRREVADFPGANVILQQLREKPGRKRIGLISTGPSPRANTHILDQNGESIGVVTSGSPSPYLNKNMAMGYLPTKFAKTGTKVKFDIRKKLIDAQVTKMPFVQTKYYNKSK